MFQVYDRISKLDFKLYKLLYRQQIEMLRLRDYSHCTYSEGILSAEEDFWYDTEEFFNTEGAIICVWLCKGKYHSSLRAEKYQDGYLLTNLETDSDYRNMGYAKMLIQGLMFHLSALGCDVLYAHISKQNQISVIVHEKLGFRRICDFATLVDGTVSNNYDTFSIKL